MRSHLDSNCTRHEETYTKKTLLIHLLASVIVMTCVYAAMNDAIQPSFRADPLRRYEATKGTRVGIVGIGGLGQMGIKLAKALGCTCART